MSSLLQEVPFQRVDPRPYRNTAPAWGGNDKNERIITIPGLKVKKGAAGFTLFGFRPAICLCRVRLAAKTGMPPTLFVFGNRDHLYKHQTTFVEEARKLGMAFDLKIYEGAGHSFLTSPAFEKTARGSRASAAIPT